MAILKGVSVWFTKLDPARPNGRMDPNNPRWEVQCRTKDPAQQKEWKDLGLKPRLIVHPEGHDEEGQAILDEDGKKTWKLNLGKNAYRKGVSKDTPLADREKSDPVECIDGRHRAVDPTTIGNGSIANIRVFIREYQDPKSGKPAKAGVLMGLQVTRHLVYKPVPQEEFDTAETERIEAQETDTSADASYEDEGGEGGEAAPKATAPKTAPPGTKPKAPVDQRDDIAF